jgi:hypothetical protein
VLADVIQLCSSRAIDGKIIIIIKPARMDLNLATLAAQDKYRKQLSQWRWLRSLPKDNILPELETYSLTRINNDNTTEDSQTTAA